jgi:hypothetical protein
MLRREQTNIAIVRDNLQSELRQVPLFFAGNYARSKRSDVSLLIPPFAYSLVDRPKKASYEGFDSMVATEVAALETVRFTIDKNLHFVAMPDQEEVEPDLGRRVVFFALCGAACRLC